MDGLKRRAKGSLRIRLSLWLSLAILGVALIAGAFTFSSAFDEAHELQDDVLRQVATLFDQRHLSLPEGRDRGGTEAEPRPAIRNRGSLSSLSRRCCRGVSATALARYWHCRKTCWMGCRPAGPAMKHIGSWSTPLAPGSVWRWPRRRLSVTKSRGIVHCVP